MRAWAMIVLTGCGTAGRVSVGPVDGTDAIVGVETRDDAVIAYVCGGDDTRMTLTRWFEGDAPDGVGELLADDWTLALDGDGAVLTDPSGVAYDVALDDATGSAGVYEATDSGCHDGAVVWDDDGLVLQGTWGCYPDQLAEEVLPVGTLRLDDTIEGEVTTDDGTRQFTLARVTP